MTCSVSKEGQRKQKHG